MVDGEDVAARTALGGKRDERHGCHRQRSVDCVAAVRKDSRPGQTDSRVTARHQTAVGEHRPAVARRGFASDPQKMLFLHVSRPVKTDCRSPFTRSVSRRDDPNTPQFHWCPVGTISLLRGRLALELPPCARSAQDGSKSFFSLAARSGGMAR